MYNKRLHTQIRENFGKSDQIPKNLLMVFKVISDSYNNYERDGKLPDSAIDVRLNEIIELNNTLREEKEELKKAHLDLTTLFEGLDEVLYSVDMVSYRLTRISAVCEKVYGYSAGEFLADGELWQKVIHPADKNIAEQNLRLLFQGKQVLDQYRIIHKDESVRWVENKIIPTLDKNGRLVRIDGVTSDISERKRTENELEKSFSILEATLESTADGLLVADFNGKIARFNKKFVELWQIPKEILDERSDEKAIEFVLDQLANPEEFLSKVKELYVKQKDISFDILKFKDGRTFERYSQPQLINDNCVGRVWSFRDITESRKAEEALRESEKRLRQIIDLVPHFIFAKEANGKFILANEAAARAYGCTVEGLIGKSDADFNSKKVEVEHFLQEDMEVVKTGKAKYNIEETITDAAGNFLTLSTTKIPYNYSGANIPGILGVSVDISERKKAETVLKESRNQLSIAAQISKLGYWEFDILKDQFTFSDQFYTIFKTTAEKMGGYTMQPDRYAELFVYPEDRPVVGQEVVNAINSPDPNFTRQIEHRIIYADGGIGWISVHFYIVKDGEGSTIKTFGVNQDITDRKKAEETILRSEADLALKNEELAVKNKALEQFAYVASHDLQEPLRTTSSFVKLIQKQYQGKLDEKADKYLNYILDASDRMKALIKSLLDYSLIGNKKELEPVDCNVVMENVLADLHVAIQETEADITYGHLPVISGYSTEIKQLFQNLLINAIKFRKKEAIPKITIAVQKLENDWEFIFKDNGIGIEEKHRGKIFDIFQRLHNRTEYEGSGIGLSYCKKIVELHNGKIWVESTPGMGSIFHFTIHQNHQ